MNSRFFLMSFTIHSLFMNAIGANIYIIWCNYPSNLYLFRGNEHTYIHTHQILNLNSVMPMLKIVIIQ